MGAGGESGEEAELDAALQNAAHDANNAAWLLEHSSVEGGLGPYNPDLVAWLHAHWHDFDFGNESGGDGGAEGLAAGIAGISLFRGEGEPKAGVA
eukprot:818594-Rhodomonas_salina.1